jgi:hypothetical protein
MLLILFFECTEEAAMHAGSMHPDGIDYLDEKWWWVGDVVSA